ncbi:MAG: CaiB/BaiF CoA-transferase family protein [Rhodoglobus sp.]|uniref:CaiB/BaiF CoA transferase family protein n=1 Tax=uncultured Salinibacterium sp. TaxID=459274 RepID=UPI0030DC293E
MLSGIRVLSFTHFLQGPSASQILADLGADVIKVEPPHGAFERSWTGPGRLINGLSPFFTLANRNVRSLAVDLKNPDALEPLLELVRSSDVLIESFRPGALDRLGLGYDALKAINPKLIYCSLSGYGSDGPYVDRPGQDVLVQAMSGLAAATGRADQDPTPVGACVVDQHAAVLGAMGILAALHGRERSGVGTRVESNLLNAALDLQIEPLNYALNGWDDSRSASGVSSSYYKAPYGVFAAADGHVCISLTSLATLSELFDDEWFASIGEENSFERRDEINDRVANYIVERPTSEWFEIFDDHRIWSAPVQNYQQVIDDPQVNHNNSFDSFDHDTAGHIRVLRHPVSYGGERPGVRTAPPALGDHTTEILAEAGYSPEAIATLTANKVFR